MQQIIDQLYYSLASGKHLMFTYLIFSCSIGLPSLVVLILAQMKSHWKALTYMIFFLLAKTCELIFVCFMGYQYTNVFLNGLPNYQLMIVFSLESLMILLLPLLINELFAIDYKRQINYIFAALCGIGLALIIAPYFLGIYGKDSSALLQEGVSITSLISFKIYRLFFWSAHLYAFLVGLVKIKKVSDLKERKFYIYFMIIMLFISCHTLVAVVIKTFPENVFLFASGYFFLNTLLLKYTIQKFFVPSPLILKENLYQLISNREKEVLLLLAEGLSNKDIGNRLYISETTVKSHVKSIYKKLQVKNRIQLLNLFKNS